MGLPIFLFTFCIKVSWDELLGAPAAGIMGVIFISASSGSLQVLDYGHMAEVLKVAFKVEINPLEYQHVIPLQQQEIFFSFQGCDSLTDNYLFVQHCTARAVFWWYLISSVFFFYYIKKENIAKILC